MAEIGYERYGAQGGDWGSFVTTALACYDTEHCVGIHLNFVFEAMQAAVSANPKDSHTPEQQRAIAAAKRFQASDSAYFAQQATRPQTVGYGLTDSPAFQAAWILQGFWAATDCDGHPENAVTRDEMLDDIMIYWLNAAGASSARIYWENPVANFAHGPVAAPTAVAVFPKEICPPVRAWCERALPNIRQWTEMPRGGHFAALEQPALFADDLRSFFAALR
jgi:pimeloyl-ACP methyl ester carboxylesterase